MCVNGSLNCLTLKTSYVPRLPVGTLSRAKWEYNVHAI